MIKTPLDNNNGVVNYFNKNYYLDFLRINPVNPNPISNVVAGNRKLFGAFSLLAFNDGSLIMVT
jgi:hypothetical protein